MRQHSLAGILGVWAAAALPMAALAWLVAPAIVHPDAADPAWFRTLVLALTVGLAWQALLVAWLVRREQGTLRWASTRQALWLIAPTTAAGRPSRRLWWLVVPLAVGFAAEEAVPVASHPAARDMATFLDSATGHDFLASNWLWWGILLVMLVLNTVLGEELLFRGWLLPRMRGVFGRADWVANGVQFAVYHLHMPWVIPGALLDTFWLSWPSRRFRSAWFGIAVHSLQSVVILVAVTALVLTRR